VERYQRRVLATWKLSVISMEIGSAGTREVVQEEAETKMVKD
jgi:hypothetical protein